MPPKNPILRIQPLGHIQINPTFNDLDGPAKDEPDVDKAFAETPAAVFDLELPWTNDCGRILNRYGVQISTFANWEHAEAVVATMNGSQALVDAVAAINAAGIQPAPTDPPRVEISGDSAVYSPETPVGIADTNQRAEFRKNVQATIEAQYGIPPGKQGGLRGGQPTDLIRNTYFGP